MSPSEVTCNVTGSSRSDANGVTSVPTKIAAAIADITPEFVAAEMIVPDYVRGSDEKTPAGLRADLSKQIGAMQLRAQVAKEILTNLQHVEQVLDAFARDGSKRDTLNGLGPYLRQIHGALVVLGFERPAEVLSICETMIAALAAADHPSAAQDMDWIAEGLSSLGFYLDPCLRGQDPQNQAITLFFRRYEQRVAGTEGAPGAGPAGGASSHGETQIIPELLLDDVPGPVTPVDTTIVGIVDSVRVAAPAPAPRSGRAARPGRGRRAGGK